MFYVFLSFVPFYVFYILCPVFRVLFCLLDCLSIHLLCPLMFAAYCGLYLWSVPTFCFWYSILAVTLGIFSLRLSVQCTVVEHCCCIRCLRLCFVFFVCWRVMRSLAMYIILYPGVCVINVKCCDLPPISCILVHYIFRVLAFVHFPCVVYPVYCQCDLTKSNIL